MELYLRGMEQPGQNQPAAPVAYNTNPKPQRHWPMFVWWGCAVVVLAVVGELAWVMTIGKPAPVSESALRPSASPAPSTAQGLALITGKDYGNKYANGILPVGDGKYSTSTAQIGSVYACSQYAQNLQTDSGGAQTRGPWFTNNNTEYDITKKPHVQGSVSWKGSFSDVVTGNTRTITTNGLPLAHTTGVFPIAATDPAYAYDRNPNSIKAQSETYTLSADPSYGAPQCMGGQVGVMLTGVPLFSAFDAGGRDAGAWEVQDDCSGHPQEAGEYHYHTLSSCIKDVGVSTVIGFALDGFPITGPNVGTNNVLTTADLDECHGITSPVTLDGKTVTTYHYVMTEDFPYSVSCFRSQAFNPAPTGGGSGAGPTTEPLLTPPPRQLPPPAPAGR